MIISCVTFSFQAYGMSIWPVDNIRGFRSVSEELQAIQDEARANKAQRRHIRKKVKRKFLFVSLHQPFRVLATPSILVTKFLVKSPNRHIQITNFSVSGHQNVTINISNLQLQLNNTAHFGDLKQKNW